MNRRQLLKRTGTILGVAALGESAGAQRDGQPPPNAPRTKVNAFGENQTVPVGNWIVHEHGVIEEADCESLTEARNTLRRFFQRANSTVIIGGEELEDPDQYWRNLINCTDTDECDVGYALVWRYAIPPQSPGTVNNYEVTIRFDPPHVRESEDRQGNCKTVEVESLEWPGGEYEVVKR